MIVDRDKQGELDRRREADEKKNRQIEDEEFPYIEFDDHRYDKLEKSPRKKKQRIDSLIYCSSCEILEANYEDMVTLKKYCSYECRHFIQ